MSELLTAAQMAQRLNISYYTFRKWIDLYGLPFYGSRSCARFDAARVLRQLESRGMVQSESEKAKPKRIKLEKDEKKDVRRYYDLLGL